MAKKKNKPFNTRKFFKMFFIKFTYRIMELTLLFAAGWALGFKLIRY